MSEVWGQCQVSTVLVYAQSSTVDERQQLFLVPFLLLSLPGIIRHVTHFRRQQWWQSEQHSLAICQTHTVWQSLDEKQMAAMGTLAFDGTISMLAEEAWCTAATLVPVVQRAVTVVSIPRRPRRLLIPTLSLQPSLVVAGRHSALLWNASTWALQLKWSTSLLT